VFVVASVKFEARFQKQKIWVPKIVVEQLDLCEDDVVGVELEKIFVDAETKKKLKG